MCVVGNKGIQEEEEKNGKVASMKRYEFMLERDEKLMDFHF